MNNGNETLGLTVISTNPSAHETCVNVNSPIEITFSADLNKSTLNNSIVVFEDINGTYNGATSLKDSSKFNIVKGSLSYANRVAKFVPKEPFKENMKYIVVLNNTIFDITGIKLIKKYIFAFNTEVVASYGKCTIIEPEYGKIFTEIPDIRWESLDAPSYIIQISKTNTFESLIYETYAISNRIEQDIITLQQEDPNLVVYETYKGTADTSRTFKTNSLKPRFNYKEGIYYLRIKAEGGEWSDPCQFFIKEITDAIISTEDQPESIYLQDFLDGLEDEIEVLEIFPKDDSVLNSLKTNIFYIKLNGIIEASRIDIKNCFIEAELYNEEDNDVSYQHKTLDGNWTIIYDTEYNCTYLILKIEAT